MQDIRSVYRENILPLPRRMRIMLASLILKEDAGEKRESAYHILTTRKRNRVFKNSAEVDEYIRNERDSWDD